MTINCKIRVYDWRNNDLSRVNFVLRHIVCLCGRLSKANER